MREQTDVERLLQTFPSGMSVDDAVEAVRAFGHARYEAQTPACTLVEFEHGPATYLFDQGSHVHAARTAVVVARPMPPIGPRDADYQRGFPTRKECQGRALDRGHFVPFSGGGLFGPNLFDQDRALNRGWSAAGRRYRALESRAVSTPGAVMAMLPQYPDDSDFPAFLDVFLLGKSGVDALRFRNRFDVAIDTEDPVLDLHLDAATDEQIGGLGEETAAVWIESELDGTIVALGDAGMPRTQRRQDLDVVAVVDGALTVFEIKTRFRSRHAGRTTRSGNLYRPRLRSGRRPNGHKQASQPYVTDRLSDYVNTERDDFAGVDVRVVAVDLVEFLIQQFAVDDTGRRMRPLSPPSSCREEAETALNRILEHRGHL